MKTLIIFIVALMPVTSTLVQGKDAKKPAEELLDLIMLKQEMRAGFNSSFAPFFKKLRQRGFPEAGVKEIAEAVDVYCDQVVSDIDFKKGIAVLFKKEFTAEELKELVAFYKTPLGHKIINKQLTAEERKGRDAFDKTPLGQKTNNKLPVILKSALKLGEKYNDNHQAGVTEQIKRIVQKHMAAPRGDAPKAEKDE